MPNPNIIAPENKPETLVKKIDLGLFKLNSGSMADALCLTESLLHRSDTHYYCFCEASLLSNIVIDERIRNCANGATAVFPDGVALIALASIHRCRLSGRVPGPTFFLEACRYGISRGWRHFLYGGAPGVAENLGRALTTQFPGIAIVGTHSPPFRTLTSEEQIAEKRLIEDAKPDLLWVCLGSPKQEMWCAENVRRINVPLMLPVGAAFDFHAGSRPWAPVLIRKIGMEWAFRALTGGWRVFFRNIRCVLIVGLYLVWQVLKRSCSHAFPLKECNSGNKGRKV